MSLLEMMKIYLQDECDNENERNKLNKIISKSDFVDEDFEKFRYQLWLDSDRAGMFFANKVLLVEGATERAIFNWLLARDWYNLSEHRIAIIDVLGKYNFHRFAGLLDKFRIPYGIMADDDGEKNDHKFRNKVIRELPGISRLSDPVFIPGCMEDFLGIEKIEDKSRADLKPVFALISLENKAIKQARLAELHDKFQLALKI
jgi:predicted ATP-dependent endonuclease of OLD family